MGFSGRGLRFGLGMRIANGNGLGMGTLMAFAFCLRGLSTCCFLLQTMYVSTNMSTLLGVTLTFHPWSSNKSNQANRFGALQMLR